MSKMGDKNNRKRNYSVCVQHNTVGAALVAELWVPRSCSEGTFLGIRSACCTVGVLGSMVTVLTEGGIKPVANRH